MEGQWIYRQLTDIIEYKAESVGIKVDYQEETYTSQTCLKCGKRHKPTNRHYKCQCGFEYHRDSVGAINILKKYTIGTLKDKSDWLEGVLTSPYGVRYDSNSTSCQTDWNSRPFSQGVLAQYQFGRWSNYQESLFMNVVNWWGVGQRLLQVMVELISRLLILQKIFQVFLNNINQLI